MKWLGLFLVLVGCANELEIVDAKESCFYEDCEKDDLRELDFETCDALEQDCPDGQKCSHVSPMVEHRGGMVCVDLVDDREEGEDCTIYNTGADSCDLGLWCWSDRCRTFCNAGQVTGCDGPREQRCVSVFGQTGVCMNVCNPMEAGTCNGGHTCSGFENGEFLCIPTDDTTPNAGASCSVDYECAPHHACEGAVCRLRCDTGADVTACPSGQTCTPDGDPPEAYPTLGYCL